MRQSSILLAGPAIAMMAISPAMAATVTVAISDYTFAPATITIHPGDRLIFANGDSVPHTATALDGKSFDTGTIDPGAQAGVVLSRTGVYPYHCAIHPEMRGTVDVK